VSEIRGVVVIGVPGNRRVDLFRRAAHEVGLEVIVVPWIELLRGGSIAERVQPGWALRIDSPGEDAEVDRELRALGGTLPGAAIDPDLARETIVEHGRIFAPRQVALGLELMLSRIERELAAVPHVALSDPSALALANDKPRCHAVLSEAGVPVPDAIDRPVADFDTLRAAMHERGWTRAFVKLAHGSSASGVLALSLDARRVLATTSVERQGDTLYNSLRARRYSDEREVRRIIDMLAPEGLHVERWFPKAAIEGRTFDLRVLAIAGRAAHTVIRTSLHPITNLHLGNRRGDPAAVFARFDRSLISAAVERAARCFPGNLHAGIDIAIDSRWRSVAVLEVNAFGDLLPGVLHDGLDPWQAQIAAIRTRGAA
jgi:hypothetical protein